MVPDDEQDVPDEEDGVTPARAQETVRLYLESLGDRGPDVARRVNFRGRLIAIEGGDAAGKATQTSMLAQRAASSGMRAVVFSFPNYDSPSGLMLRQHLTAQWAVESLPGVDRRLVDSHVRQALMTLNRYEDVPAIEEELAAGSLVVLDRWWGSSLAYGEVENVARGLIEAWSCRLTEPDAWVLLRVSAEESAARRPPRDLNEVDAVKQAAVRLAYDGLFRRLPNAHVVDGSRPIDVVHQDLWRITQDVLRNVSLPEGRLV